MPTSAKYTKTRKNGCQTPHFLRRLSSWLVLSTALTLGVSKVAGATTVYWDSDGNPAGDTVTGTSLGGTGTWDASSALWWNGYATTDQAWNNSNFDFANFSGTAGTVTLGTNVSAGGLSFNTTGYTVSGASTLTLGGASTPFITVGSGMTATISASLAGTAGFNANGLGTLVLSGNNSGLSGGLTISSGTVTAASANALGSNNITLGSTTGSNTASLLVNTTGLSFSNAITLATNSSTGTLTVGNSGTAISTTFTGGVTGTNNFTINEGGSTGSVTFSGSSINNAGTVTNAGSGSGTTTITGGIGSNVTGIIESSTTSSITISSTALTVNSGGTTLINTAASGGVLTVSGGVTGTGNLILSNNGAVASGILLSTTAVNNNGAIINQGTSTGSVLISAPIGSLVTGITQNSAGSSLTLSSTATTFNGPINVNAGTLSLTGSLNGGTGGALTVAGGNFSYAPTGTGNSQSVSGVVVNAGGSAINASTGNTLVLNSVVRNANGTVAFNSTGSGTISTTNGNVNNILGPWATYGSGTSLAYATVNGGNLAAYTYTGAGDSTIAAATSITSTAGTVNYSLNTAGSGTAGNNASIDTLRSATGAVTVTPASTGGLTANGIMNSGTGTLTIGSGSLIIGAGAAGYANELILATNTQALTVSATITGTGSVTLDPTSSGVITVSNANNTGLIINAGQGTSTSVITTVGSNVTGIIETGASGLTITNAVTPTASLNTFVNNGSAALTFTGGIAAGTQGITFNANGTGAISGGAIASTGTITNSGTGTGTTTLTTIPATITNITENSAGSALTTGALTVASGGTTLVNNNASGSAIFNESGAIAGTGSLTLQNNSAVGANTVGATTGGLTLAAINNTGTLSSTGTGTGTTVITGIIGTAVTGVTIGGTSPVIFEGVNTYTSATTINSGATLQLGNSSGTGTTALMAATAAIADNGTLIFAPGTGSIGYANPISGTGNITLNGALTTTANSSPANITLSATTSAFTGTYTLNQGRIQITAATNLGSPTSILVNGNSSALTGGQLLVNATSVTVSTPITLNGYGPSESGGNLGALRLNSGSDIYSGPITLGSNASIYTPASTSVTVSGVISGGASAQLMIGAPITGTGLGTGLGTLSLTNTNTYSGGTLISGETAALGAVGALGSGAVQVGISSTQTSSGITESVANALTGTNSLTVNAGTVALSQSNNYTGGTTVNNGTLTITGASAIGTGALNVTGGTLNANVANALGTVSLNQSGGTVAESVANAFQGLISLNLTGGTTNLSFANNYYNGATISGTNVTNISAAGALSGITNVQSGGTLSSNLATTSASGGTVLVNSGGILASAAAGGAFQNITLNSGSLVNPGGVGTIGTGLLTITNLLANTGSTLQFDIQSPSSFDQLSVAGAYTFGTGINLGLNNFGQLPNVPGTYSLVQFSGAVPSLSDFVLPSAPSGETYALSVSGNTLNLTISGTYAAISANWVPTGSPGPFSWNTAANWSGGVVPQLAGDTANFNSALAGAQTVTLDGQQHVGTLILNPSAAFGYTVNAGAAGSALYLDNTTSVASIQNLAQNNTINAPIVLSSNTNVTVATGTNLTLGGTISGSGELFVTGGTGSLTLSGTSSWTGGTEIDSGSIVINNTSGGAITPIAGVVTLNGGTLNFTGVSGNATTLPSNFVLNIGAGGGTLNVGGTTSGTAGKLNTNAVVGFLTGSGTFTKTGGGVLQDGSPSIGFNGNVILSNNGLIEDQSVAALGFGTGTGFGGGSVTINGPSGANAPELVVSVGTQLFNPVTLNGGTLSTDNGNTAIINSTVNVTAASTLRASDFYATTSARVFAINTLTGSSNLAVNGSTASGAIGLVTLGNASGYTGTITIGANAALGIGSGSFFGAGATIANFTNATSGIGLVADGDGTSSPQTIAFTLPSQVTAATFGTGNTTGYIVGKQGATTLFNQEANKTISFSTALPYNNTNTLNVQPFNGYGLLLTAQPNLTATTTFGVGTVTSIGGNNSSQPSNVIPGLTLTHLAGTSFGINKTGVGTLQLGTSASDASNTFGFTAATPAAINVTGGIVSAFADQNLGATGNGITLNSTSGAEFLALNSFSTGRTITLSSATGATIGVAGGATLTITSGLAYGAAGNTLTKVEDGTLILSAAATGSPTSGTTVNAGTLQISASNQIGSGTITDASPGASIQLTGGGTFTQAVALNSVGISSTVGGLTNLSGATTLSGTITISGGSVISNQDTNNTFTLGAIVNTTTGFDVSGPGNVTVTGVISNGATAGVTQVVGPGSLRITAAMTTSGATGAYGGQLIFSGAGVQGTGGLGVGFGGTLTLDNTASNTNNRGAGHTLGMNAGGGATLNIIGNASAATTEQFLGVNYGRGENIIQLSPNAAQSITATLTNTGGTFTHGTFSSVVYQAPGLGSAAAAGVGVINEGPIANTGFQGAFVTGGQINQQIQPWALAYNSNNPTSAITFATANAATGANYRTLAGTETTSSLFQFNGAAGTATGLASTTSGSSTITVTSTAGLTVGESVTGSASIIPAGAYVASIINGTTFTISAAASATATGVSTVFSTAGTNINATTALTGANLITLSPAINSLTLATGGSLTLGNTQTLTIGGTSGGGILATDTTSGNTISGGIITAGANELDVHTVGNLAINSTITGGAGGAGVGLTKGESGTLTIGANAFYSGQTVVNGGALVLAAGNNTIQFANYMTLGTGATLNLNGNSQIFTDLLSDNSVSSSISAPGLGTLGGNSTVTGTSGSMVVIKGDGANRTFSGTMTGALGLVHSNTGGTWTLTQNSNYTGPTLINGGTVILQNSGALSGTSSLTINRAALTLDNTGSQDSSSRLSSTTPISLGGGTINYLGRTQFNSAQTLGAVTLTEGSNTIALTQQDLGVSGLTLTLGGATPITRSTGATINFTNNINLVNAVTNSTSTVTVGSTAGLVVGQSVTGSGIPSGATIAAIGSNFILLSANATASATITANIPNAPLGMIGSANVTYGANAPTLTNNLIGGGYLVNGIDFASYNATYGVGALSAPGFAGYSPLLINNAGTTDNVSMGAGTGVPINSETINSLRITGTTAINFSSNSQTLTLSSGGLLATGNLNLGGAINQGNLTSGGNELFLLGGSTGTIINSAITGAGMSLVKSGSGTYLLVGTNSYTGGTYVDQGTLNLGNSTNLGNATTGLTTLGTGGIFLNGGNLTQTAGAVIPQQAATISGGSTLTLSSSLSSSGTTTLGSNVITVASTNGIAIGQLVSGTGIPGNEFVTAINPATNQVTITSGSGVTAGTNTISFLVNNSLSSLTFNNDGGSAPTVSVTGVLNLPNGTITASSNNVAITSTLSGGTVDLGNAASPTITVNPIAFNGQNIAPLQPTLIISSALQDASNAVFVTGGGNLQLSGASTFSGGVTLDNNTSLTIAANSTNAASGQPVTGPLGSGTLTVGTGSTLLSTGTFTVGNNVVVTGNFTFDAPSSSPASLTLGAGSQTIALPASAATTVTVNAPNMTGVFNDTVTGNGAILVKAGLGTLQLNNNAGASSTFNGGVVINAGTLLATGIGATGTSLGTGPVIINGGVLQLHHSGLGGNSAITYGNNVDISTSLANAYIDVNNAGANTGNTIIMGTLDYGTVNPTTFGFTSTVAGNAAPSTILNITGANSYKLQFTGTTLTSATSSATFNIASGLTLILPGGFTVGTNLPTNIGGGTLLYSGSNSGAVASSPITSTVGVAPATGGSSSPLGTGGITLGSGGTLLISPVYGTLSTTGYTSGGAAVKYYTTGGTTIYAAGNYGVAAGSSLNGVSVSDRIFGNTPVGVTATTGSNSYAQNTLGTYQALLTVTTGGTYNFGMGVDDLGEIVVDGQVVQNITTISGQVSLQSINLSAGVHQITVRIFNSGSGGGGYVLYSGPDTASNGITGQPPVSNLATIPLSAMSYATNYVSGNNYQNAAILNNAITVASSATATVDGSGTDFNYAVPSLTLNAGSTLTVANGAGTSAGSAGNGVFIVTGLTTVAAAGTSTVSPTTGTLVLAGGVSDGGFGLTKTGAGNLILGASAGTFTGAFNISGGFVQLQDPAGLTTGTTTIGVATTTPATLDLNGQAVSTTGNIILNGGAGPASKSSNTPAGLYNSSATTASLPVGGFLSIGAQTGGVDASIGGFGDINVLGTIQDSVAGSPLDKVGPDTLILSNTNTFTGAFNIKGGIVKLTGANGFSSSATNTVTVSSGATIDLNGQNVTVAKPLNLTGAGLAGLGIPNELGALVNSSSSAASYAGNITLAGTTSIGGPSLIAGTNGGITLSGTISGANQITKIGANSLTLTGAGAETIIDLQDGSLTFSGSGAQSITSNADFIRQGTTFTLDNTATAVSQRLGGHGLYLTGSLVINGNSSTAVAETINQSGNNINVGQANGIGQATITLNAVGTAGINLSVASTSTSIFNRGAGSTMLLRGTNLGNAQGSGVAAVFGNATSLGQSANNAQSVGQAGAWNAPNALIYQWAVADQSATGVGTGFAGYSTYGGSANFGATANVGGVAPIGINANNALSSAPTLSLINANTTQNNSTITVTSSAGLSVGQLVTGANIPANAVITSIPNGTSFTISAVVNNASGATANTNLVVYANPTTTFSSVTTTASTTVTVSSTANLYVGEVVAGVSAAGVATGFVPNGDTIASIVDGTHITLTTAATAGTNPSLIFGLPGYANIASTASSFSIGSTSVAQEQNSLTLNNASGSTLTLTGSLQLDSGGVLAVGTNAGSASYTISGPGTLTGTNSLNREMIFHVTGSGTTLTVNAPIYTNGGGLTKADGGTLVLGSTENYTGNTVLNGGTTQLNGGTNTIFTVYTIASSAGNSGATVSGQVLDVNSGATLDLNGNNQAVSNLASGSSTQLAGGTIINSTGTATLHIAPNANQIWAGNISNAGAGVLNFVRDGNNTFTVNSPNTFSGTVTLTGGATTLQDLGTFQNASAVNVTRSTLIWNDQVVQAVSNRLSSTAPITLTGAGLQFLTRGSTGSTPVSSISLGTLNLGIGESDVLVSSVGQGATASITFAGLGTRALGSTLNFGNTSLSAGDNPHYYFTTAPTLTNGIIGAWATVTSIDATTGAGNIGFATYDPAAGIRVLQYQPAVAYGAGVNLGLTATATIPAPLNVATTTTINSLSIYNATLNFTNANDTLVVQSGGILSGTTGNGTIGSTALPGIIQSGAGNDLYIHNGSNTLTINSKIIDNGSNNNVIIDGVSTTGNTITLTNANTYGGTTYLSGATLTLNSLLGPAIPHDVVLSGGNNAAADSLSSGSTSLNWGLSNQLTSTANVTIDGAAQINMGGSVATFATGPNTQTLNNITFNNDGGSNGGNGPAVYTGAGTLTINGTITSTNNAESFTIPVVNGFVNLTTGNIVVNANQVVANQIGLALNANITASSLNVTGTGWLGIGGQSSNFTGAVNVNTTGGGLAISTSGALLGGQVVLSSGTTLDTRGLSGTIGSLASSSTTSVVENGLQGTAGTLTTGLDNTNSTFAGTFFSPFPTGLLNVAKIGTGTLTLTNNSTATNSGTLTVSDGQVTVNGTSGILGFSTYTVNPGAVLLLDDSTNAVNNRLGGAFLTTSAATLSPTLRALNLQGGTLQINGKAGTAVSEALGTITGATGSMIVLNAAGTGGINVTLQSLLNQGAGTSLLIAGDGLGSAAGANVATVSFPTAGALGTPTGLILTGGGGANNTFTRSIRSDVLVSSSASGANPEFLTIDSVTGLVRPLNTTTELQSTATQPIGYTLNAATTSGSSTVTVGSTSGMVVGEGITDTTAGIAAGTTITSILSGTQIVVSANATSTQTGTNVATFGLSVATQNVKTAATTPLFANATINSLTLNSGGGFSSGIIAGNAWGSNGGLLTLSNTSTGLLNTAGNNTISVGAYNYAGVTADFHILTGSTLTMNAALTGSTGGLTKSEGGTLILNQPFFGNNAQTITINGGTLQLGTNVGANALWVYTNGTSAPSAEVLAVNNGTFDLNGNNQLVGAVTSTNPLPYGGGTAASPNNIITNSSATTATLATNAAASVFSGEITGNLNFDKTGNTTMTLSSPQTYTGTTTVRGGVLSLRDSGSIASTAAINLTFGELILDNTGLSENTARISAAAPVNFNGGSFRINTGQRVDSENLGTFNLNSGANLLYINQYNNNGNTSSPTLNIANLTQTNSATLFIEAPFSTTLGNYTAANAHVYLTQVNGAPYSTAAMTNGIIAPWMVVGNTAGATSSSVIEWATYSNTVGITTPGQNGTAGYSSNALTAAGVSDNVSATASVTGATARTINSLAVRNPAATTYIGMNSTTDQLNIASGGILLNDSQSKGIIIGAGSLTAGNLNQNSTLYFNSFNGTSTINAPIVNNGTGVLSIVRSGNGTFNLSPALSESFNFAASAAATSTLTVANGSVLSVGMGVTGSLIASNTTITAISGNVITLSANTTANGTTATPAQLIFSPVTSTSAVGTTTAGSTTVTIAASSLPTGFVPTVGMVLGSSVNLPSGATITAVSLGTTDTFTISAPAITSSATASLVFNALSNTYAGTTTVSAMNDGYSGGTTNLAGFAGSVTVPGNLVINGGATVAEVTNQGQIAATSNVTINGGGTLTLVGTNTLNSVAFNNSGGIANPTVNVGTLLNLSSATPITSSNDNTGTVSTITGGTLNFANAGGATISTTGASLNDLVISSIINTTGTLTKAGNGSLILNPVNVQAGLTTTNAASTLTVTSTNGLAVGEAVSGTGIASGTTIASIAGNVVTLSANMNASGTNTISFTGANNFSQGINLAGGTLTLMNGSFVTNGVIVAGSMGTGPLTISGANVGLQGGGGGITLANPVTFTANSNLTIGGQHSNNNVTFTGLMNLNGQTPTFTIPTVVSTGAFNGTIYGGTNGFTKAGPGIMTLTPTNALFGSATVSGNSTVTVSSTAGLAVGEPVSGANIPNTTIASIVDATHITLAANATNTGSAQVTATGNTFTGPISVTGGLLTMGNAGALGLASGPNANIGEDVTVATGAELNMNAFALSIGSLSGGGIVTDSSTAQALTIGTGSNATNATFSGTLTAATQASLSLIKTGTNNQTLSGTSYYTGVTTVSGGTLTLKNGSSLATTPTLNNTAITVASGATLAVSAAGANVGTNNTVNIGDVAGTNAGAALTLSNGANLDLRDGAIDIFKILGNGSGTSFTSTSATTNLYFDIGNAGADLMVLSRAASVTGGTINLNVLAGATGIPLGVIPLITAGSGFTGTATNNFTLANSTITIGAKTYTLTLAGGQDTSTQTALLVTVAAPTNAYWSGAVNANWNTGSATGVTNWRTDATSNIDTQAIPTSATNVFFNTTTPTAANLSTNLAQAFSIASLTFTGAATSPVSIGDSGSNTNTLTIGAGGINVNAGAGADTINANVILGTSETWTNNSSNTLTVNGSATSPSITGAGLNLTVNGSGNTAIAAAIQTVAGGLTYSGTGTLALSGTNTYKGATTISSGDVQISSAANLGDSTQVTNSINLGSGTLESTSGTYDLGVNRTVNLTGAGTIQSDTGTLTVSGAISNGTNTLTVTGSGNTNISGVIGNGTGGLNKNGSGTLTLSASNTYTGDTNVNQGKVVVSGSLAGNVNIVAGATLASGANITSQVAAINALSNSVSGGTVAPGGSGGVADLSTVGQLNATGAVTLGTASTTGVAHLSIEIGGANDGTTGGNATGPLQYDRVAMSGSTLTLNSANLDISPVNGYTYTGSTYNDSTQQLNLDSHIFFVITGASNVVGTFANQFAAGTDPNVPGFATIYGTNGQEFAISYTANFQNDTFTGGNDVAIMAIPEPNSMSMLAGSLGVALGLQRMRRRRKA